MRSRCSRRHADVKTILSSSAHELGDARKGLLFAFAAYGIWGIAPIYFVWVSFAQPLEVVAHRCGAFLAWATVIAIRAVARGKEAGCGGFGHCLRVHCV